MDGTAPAPPPFGRALAHALQERNLTLQNLRDLLAERGHSISVATLSYWQTGRSTPRRTNSLRAISEIEHVLELGEGQLRRLLPDRSGEVASFADVFPVDEEIERARRDLAMDTASGLAKVALQEMLVVNADHTSRQSLHQLLRCTTTRTRFIMAIHLVDDEVPSPVLEEGFGMSVHTVVELERGNGFVAKLDLGRELGRDELAWVGYDVVWSSEQPPVGNHTRILEASVDVLVEEVRFDGDLPRLAMCIYTPPEQDEPTEVVVWEEPTALLQYSREHAPPGAYALYWAMPGADLTDTPFDWWGPWEV